MLCYKCGLLYLILNKLCYYVNLRYYLNILRVPTYKFLLYLREECAYKIYTALFFRDVFYLTLQYVKLS
jgi:hypothetical protein